MKKVITAAPTELPIYEPRVTADPTSELQPNGALFGTYCAFSYQIQSAIGSSSAIVEEKRHLKTQCSSRPSIHSLADAQSLIQWLKEIPLRYLKNDGIKMVCSLGCRIHALYCRWREPNTSSQGVDVLSSLKRLLRSSSLRKASAESHSSIKVFNSYDMKPNVNAAFVRRQEVS